MKNSHPFRILALVLQTVCSGSSDVLEFILNSLQRLSWWYTMRYESVEGSQIKSALHSILLFISSAAVSFIICKTKKPAIFDFMWEVGFFCVVAYNNQLVTQFLMWLNRRGLQVGVLSGPGHCPRYRKSAASMKNAVGGNAYLSLDITGDDNVVRSHNVIIKPVLADV